MSSNAARRVAVIGGTGFVGRYVIDALHAAGHATNLLVRPGSESKVVTSDMNTIVSGDIDSEDAIGRTLEGADAVIYLVGILREYPRRGITFEATQYDGVVRAADAAVSAGIRRFVLMSANGVEVQSTPYQRTKLAAERYAQGRELDVTVLRPSVIFGDPDGRMEFATQLYQDIVRLPLPAIGFFSGWSPKRGAVLMSPVHAEDVATAFVRALDDPATIGKTYALGGPDVMSWNEMIQRVAAAVGKRKLIVPMPIALMKGAATLFDWLPFFPVTRDQLTMLAENNTCDSAPLEALIGRPPKRFTVESLEYLSR